MIQANTVLDDPVTFNFMYTDSYHQNFSDFKTFSTYLYLFATNPPYFKQDLISVLGDKCYDIQFMLPEITDPNGENVTVKFAPNTPDWISIRDNSVVYISSASKDNVAEGLTEIEIILQNESKAWSNYSLNVTIDQLIVPSFGSIPDYQLSQLSGNVVFINVTSINKVYVVDWAGNNLISFLQFNNSMLSLKENTTNSNLLDTTWVKLASLDSCNSTVYSNPFKIVFNSLNHAPVAFLNNNQFNLSKGIYTLFELPDNSFVDFDGDKLIYKASVINCTNNNHFAVGIHSSKYTDIRIIIYAYSNYSMNWIVSLSAYDIHNQSTEAILYFSVINWAEKSWSACKGPYQNQWTQCDEFYSLSSTGAWIRNDLYFSFLSRTLFEKLGLIAWFAILLHLLLSLCLGRNLLNNIENIQLVVVLLWSNIDIDQTFLREFLTNILYIKFDFGFIRGLMLSKEKLWWSLPNDQMVNMQFYCQSTIQNYVIPLVFIIIIILWLICILKVKFLSKIFDKVKNAAQKVTNFRNNRHTNQAKPEHIIEWWGVHLFFKFTSISIISDIVNLVDHPFLSFCSILLIIIFWAYLFKTKFEILKISFIKEMEQEYSDVDKDSLVI